MDSDKEKMRTLIDEQAVRYGWSWHTKMSAYATYGLLPHLPQPGKTPYERGVLDRYQDKSRKKR